MTHHNHLKIQLACLSFFILLTISFPVRAKTLTSHPFKGITLYQIVASQPRPQVIYIAQINTHTPGISFLVTPGNGDPNASAQGDPNLETTRQTTLQFIKDQQAQLGINGSFFTFVRHTLNTNNISLVMSKGHLVSPPSKGRNWVINITKDNQPQIISVSPGQIKKPDSRLYNAIAGSTLLVHKGKNVAPKNSPQAPRTAVAINQKGLLLLVTVDGRQPGFSEGMTLHQLGAFLIAHGAVIALNLDGGGSTTMAIANPRAHVVNFPSDPKPNGRPGQLRKVGVNLGVFAKLNTNNTPLVRPSRPAPSKPEKIADHLTIIDDFSRGVGHFGSSPPASGSDRGLYADADRSSIQRVKGNAQSEQWSQKITLTTDTNQKTSMLVRLLSGYGSPVHNVVMGKAGHVGFFLKTKDKNLTVRIALDDQVSRKNNTSFGMEQSGAKKVIADGKWHLYQWNIADQAQWFNFFEGNGALEGPNTTIDSILFYANNPKPKQRFTVYLDTVAYNPNGTLGSLLKTEKNRSSKSKNQQTR